MQAKGSGNGTELTAKQVEAINRALADPSRYRMLQEIAGEPSLACRGLSARGCLSPATISHHVKELQAAGLLEVEREGRGLRLTLRRKVWEAYLRELASL